MIADHNINWLTRLASRDAMVASRTYPVVEPEEVWAVTRLQYRDAPQQRHGGNGRIGRMHWLSVLMHLFFVERLQGGRGGGDGGTQ